MCVRVLCVCVFCTFRVHGLRGVWRARGVLREYGQIPISRGPKGEKFANISFTIRIQTEISCGPKGETLHDAHCR